MGRILRRLKRLVRSEESLDPGRPGENTDALAAAAGGAGRVDPQSGGGHAGAPPNYVKTDDGRPRH
jgi:hypothetical protein